MTAFRIPVDIANRALQQVGAKRIGTSDFSEVSKNCSEVASCYDKLREAELQSRYWKFAIKRTILRARDANMMLLAPSLWTSTTNYFIGAIIQDPGGNFWESSLPNNIGNDPTTTPAWRPYCGPMGVPLYDSTGGTAYMSGELIYTAAGDGTSRIYRSLIDGNSDNPATATAWSATTTYFKNQIVTRTSVAYMSLIDLNTNQDPALAPAAWAAGTTYASGQKVAASDGAIYQSSANGNVGNNPTIDGGSHWTNTGVLSPWTTSFVGGSGSVNWLEIGGSEFPSGVTLQTLNVGYPIGSGPINQSTTRNVFVLPGNYLRLAPQNPKMMFSPLGGPTGFGYDDWLIEGPFLITSDVGPISLRFVANITDVSLMHAMFCEGMAVKVAIEICEPLTQSGEKQQLIARKYNEYMGRAKIMDAIEEGPEDQPDDTYILCRA
jgi:hypothetical protein